MASSYTINNANAGLYTPIGSIMMYSGIIGDSLNGWLLCDGTAYSRGIYANLWNTIGISYGKGDDSTTFNVPDLTNRFIYGISSDTNLHVYGGNDTISITSVNMPAHYHTGTTSAPDSGHSHSYPFGSVQNNRADNYDGTYFSESKGANEHTLPKGGTSNNQSRNHTHTFNILNYGTANLSTSFSIIPDCNCINFIIKY